MSKIGNHRVGLQENPFYASAYVLHQQFDRLMATAKTTDDLHAIKLGWNDAKGDNEGNGND